MPETEQHAQSRQVFWAWAAYVTVLNLVMGLLAGWAFSQDNAEWVLVPVLWLVVAGAFGWWARRTHLFG